MRPSPPARPHCSAGRHRRPHFIDGGAGGTGPRPKHRPTTRQLHSPRTGLNRLQEEWPQLVDDQLIQDRLARKAVIIMEIRSRQQDAIFIRELWVRKERTDLVEKATTISELGNTMIRQ